MTMMMRTMMLALTVALAISGAAQAAVTPRPGAGVSDEVARICKNSAGLIVPCTRPRPLV